LSVTSLPTTISPRTQPYELEGFYVEAQYKWLNANGRSPVIVWAPDEIQRAQIARILGKPLTKHASLTLVQPNIKEVLFTPDGTLIITLGTSGDVLYVPFNTLRRLYAKDAPALQFTYNLAVAASKPKLALATNEGVRLL